MLKSRRYLEGQRDPDTGEKLPEIDPKVLSQLFLKFVLNILDDYGFVTKVYADSADHRPDIRDDSSRYARQALLYGRLWVLGRGDQHGRMESEDPGPGTA